MAINQQADPLIGLLVDGRYRVRARIARGGMATVYVATDLRLERRVALKVMHGHLSDDSVFQSRFIQEARAAARLADPNVVNVFDQGQDGELAYLVMEYLPGITLRELLSEQRRLGIEQTVTIMHAVLSGLAAAHRAGIVHRDVKPENVLLAEDGRIKIGDFGLARATTANTATGQQLLGTIAYLAPELVTRGVADARSDIYSLGIMLYEMLTGEQPYRGEQPMQIAFQHATEQVPRPSIRNSAIPESLDELVLWSTEKSPDERPVDAAEMLARLREIEAELGISPVTAPITGPTPVVVGFAETGDITKVLPGTGASTAPTVTVEPQVDNATRLRRRAEKRHARGGWLLTLILLLAVAAGGAGWWFGSGPGSLVEIPPLSGSTFARAEAALDELTLTATRDGEHTLDFPEGQVIRTEPEAGERVDRQSSVRVVVSLGPALHELAALRGQVADQARSLLTSLDIQLGDDIPLFSQTIAEDSVAAAEVTSASDGSTYRCDNGCEVYSGDTIALFVSLGAVPDVTGETVADATRILEDVGLKVDPVHLEEHHETFAAGEVIGIGERPQGGSWRPGENIVLIVSQGPEPVEVPDVMGWTIRNAVSELRKHGFDPQPSVKDVELLLGYKAWDIYRVRGMDPSRGEMVAPGSSITLTAGP